jgi:hypothetical protein
LSPHGRETDIGGAPADARKGQEKGEWVWDLGTPRLITLLQFAIHRDTDWLVKNLHAKVLPSDYGGNLESVRDYMGMWKEIMMENSDWFRAQENVKIVGTPPKKIERFINNIGIEGSFRQLNID